MDKVNKVLQKALLSLIGLYRATLSPLLGQRCRFYPSCSEYMGEAIMQHGVLCGLWLGLKRLAKCHPGCPGGIDWVPPKIKNRVSKF